MTEAQPKTKLLDRVKQYHRIGIVLALIILAVAAIGQLFAAYNIQNLSAQQLFGLQLVIVIVGIGASIGVAITSTDLSEKQLLRSRIESRLQQLGSKHQWARQAAHEELTRIAEAHPGEIRDEIGRQLRQFTRHSADS